MALTAKKVYAILKRQISDMEAKLNSPVRYRGTVATADLLPLNPDIGDMYNIESKSVYGEAGMNVAWNGVVWDTMGAPIDMSLYLTKEEAETVIQRLVTEYFEKNPVKPGATTEQAQQIEQNKTDIASLKTETGSLREDISTKISKFYASSQGETHLADSDNGKIMDMMVYGRSEQKSTTGAQLINTFGFKAINGVLTIDEDGVATLTNNTNNEISGIQFDLSTLENSQYTFKNYSNVGYYVMLDSVNYDHLIQPNNSFTFTKTDFLKILGVNIQPGKSANFKCMLEKGSEATSFEPYTGGQPSPSPDYPQEIKSVVNPTVKVVGKNLLNPTMKTSTYRDVTCTNNGDGTYTINGSNTTTANVFTLGKVYLIKDKKYKMIGCPLNPGKAYLQLRTPDNVAYKNDYSNGVEFVAPESGKYIVRIYYDVESYDNLLFKPMLTTDLTATYDDFEPYHEQTVTLPYTLNAIPVSSGGNVTIGGQQYVSDYFDVERGKLVRMVGEVDMGTLDYGKNGTYFFCSSLDKAFGLDNIATTIYSVPKVFTAALSLGNAEMQGRADNVNLFIRNDSCEDVKTFTSSMRGIMLYYQLPTPTEIDLTEEEIAALKALATYYPTTNISVNSEQLDGYTVFNYPISMQNGWNYVKKQIGDTRDYIYDMDARTQDTDLQAAEAYVNSEYAVALTELEV